jgi:hypothetical protein
MNISFQSIGISFLMGLVLLACNQSGNKTSVIAESKKDSTSNISNTKLDSSIDCDSKVSQYASLISGDTIATFDDAFQKATEALVFRDFSKSLANKWQDFEANKLKSIKDWESAHRTQYPEKINTVFYPFSGPDILYASQFYPNAEHFIMIGLEPVGTYPSLTDTLFTNHLDQYYKDINTSLHAIIKFSFFRTLSMEVDFKKTHVNGTLHLLNLFLAKMNHSVCNAQPLVIDGNGGVKIMESFEVLAKSDYAAKGVRLNYKDESEKKKDLIYWSMDVSDANIDKHPELLIYLKSLDNQMSTYMKGASYLCHLADFDEIRTIILDKSKTLLQDDSGVPVRFFKDDQWSLNFFGSYKKPINLFAHKYQRKLDSIYNKAPNTPEALSFGIGYIYEDKASNLMLGIKK